MLGDTYLFIDGAYLKTVYRDVFAPLFGDKYAVDYKTVKETFGARRVFLYDCLDDVQRAGESDAEFKSRVTQQEEHFDSIDKVEGVHVRYGHLSPGKKRQQKEVDVLLAVDMLTHAFTKNMDEAVLLSGDRDFKPVVESIVRHGTLVKVAYDSRTGSRPLARAADSEMELDITLLCNWIKLDKYEDRGKHFPYVAHQHNCNEDPFKLAPGYRSGVIGLEKLALGICFQDHSKVWVTSVQIRPRDYTHFSFCDKAKLLDYLTVQFGGIKW